MEGGDAPAQVARLHAARGTTSLLATTMTAPRAELEAAVAAIGAACATRPPGGARILGVHLEGPYLDPSRLGAQPECTRAFDPDEFARLAALAPIRLVTLAPEVQGHMPAIEALVAAGHKVQLGHTGGRYEDALEALSRGAAGFTHLFNAMTGLHHREPGMAGAALAHATYAEIIPDLLHVHPGAIRVALRAIPRLYCVSDSTAAAGMPDGDYRLGRQRVTKCLGGVRLADGTLAGSALTLDQALRNLVLEIGLDLADASRRVSTYAADHLGLEDRGRLAAGAWGDVVELDHRLALRAVHVEGEAIELVDAA
jgi:N-acetylglucosamine-6-phosphate deacetylase